MARPADPELEDRILEAADVLWRRGGDRALSMRSVAKRAGTNTPAVYRRFKDRQDLMRALLLRIAARTRQHFQRGETVEEFAETYIDSALRMPYEYRLFYTHGSALNPQKTRGAAARPIRESRPNFGFLEQLLARQMGGAPGDHTELALGVWAMLHGTTMLLLSKSIPQGHEEAMRQSCRAAVKIMVECAGRERAQAVMS
jgi:AcrR family transcriptional regulator